MSDYIQTKWVYLAWSHRGRVNQECAAFRCAAISCASADHGRPPSKSRSVRSSEPLIPIGNYLYRRESRIPHQTVKYVTTESQLSSLVASIRQSIILVPFPLQEQLPADDRARLIPIRSTSSSPTLKPGSLNPPRPIHLASPSRKNARLALPDQNLFNFTPRYFKRSS